MVVFEITVMVFVRFENELNEFAFAWSRVYGWFLLIARLCFYGVRFVV